MGISSGTHASGKIITVVRSFAIVVVTIVSLRYTHKSRDGLFVNKYESQYYTQYRLTISDIVISI